MIPLLPKWVLNSNNPAFYDTESATAIEMVAKLYGSMNTLIDDYNKFVDNTNQIITDFNESTTKDIESFKIAMRQEFQDFIDIVDMKIIDQDETIRDAVEYMKVNLISTIDNALEEMKDNGDFDEAVLKVFADYQNELNVLTARMNTFTKLNEGSSAGDSELADARIDYEGKEWDNVGEHIRGVSSQLSSDIDDLLEATTIVSGSTFIEINPTVVGNEDEAIASGGQLQTSKTGKIYNMYTVNSGETYYVSGMCNGFAYNGNHSSPLVVFKNDSDVVVSFIVGTEENVNIAITDLEVNVPDDATKMYVNGTYQSIGAINQNPIAKTKKGIRALKKWSNLYGKKVYFVGDSVCKGAENSTSYADLIAEKYGMVMTKDGVNGSTLVTSESNSICSRVEQITETFDYVILEGGFNDMFGSKPIGTISDGFIGSTFDTTTVIGALEKIFESLYLSNPEAKKLYVLTHRKTLANYWPGHVQDNYWDAIKTVCKKWSIPYIDLSECSGLAIWGSSFEKYFYEPQGTHPLIEGYKKFYCPKIESAMENL